MELKLDKKPKNPIIIEGFPGFGFVGTIATEFLIDHLNAKPIGKILTHEIMPIAAIHDSKIVEPLGLYYDSKNNIILIHAVTSINGLEWKISDIVHQMVIELNAKELISLEGVGIPNAQSDDVNVFYYSNVELNKKRFEKTNAKPLKEGIIMGVTGSVLLHTKMPMSCIFVETKSNMPDSRGAAKIIETLDKYLNLNVDYKPLLKKAEEFEAKLKKIMEQSKAATTEKEKKELNYLG
ncbi:proteasome assembly chaperone family protein [Candidatus Woesearchaeota archaeon]|nr:proteasome assembly chaperone family protein [Candidatus Woesearchaeota archaeon]